MVVFLQKWLYSGKVVLFGQKCFNPGNIVVMGESGCIRESD